MFKCKHTLIDYKYTNLSDFELRLPFYVVPPAVAYEATCSRCRCVVRDQHVILDVAYEVIIHLQAKLRQAREVKSKK